MNNAMRIVAMEGFGGTDVLHMAEVEPPKPGAGELLIQVAAAGLNRADILQIRRLREHRRCWAWRCPAR
jgi:NADPH:quinone reductase-like Zn-dependent oxidoreductase